MNIYLLYQTFLLLLASAMAASKETNATIFSFGPSATPKRKVLRGRAHGVSGYGNAEEHRQLSDTVSISFPNEPPPLVEACFISDIHRYQLDDPGGIVDDVIFYWRVDTDVTDNGGGYNWSPWEQFTPNYGENGEYWQPEVDYDHPISVQLKVEAMSGSTVLDEAVSLPFDLALTRLHLIRPNGGLTLVQGTDTLIEWEITTESYHPPIMEIFFSSEIFEGPDYWTRIHEDWTATPDANNRYQYTWTIPFLGSTDVTRIKVNGICDPDYGIMISDESDADNRVIESDAIPSVSLIYPNPYLPGLLVMQPQSQESIVYEVTQVDEIDNILIFLSLNDGETWISIASVTTDIGSEYLWVIPNFVPSTQCKIRIVMTPTAEYEQQTVISSNTFAIMHMNRRPYASAGSYQTVMERRMVTLDGTGSYDPDGDAISYAWTVFEGNSLVVTLDDTTLATPTFTAPNVWVEVELWFILIVSDGDLDSGASWTKVTVMPYTPAISSYGPRDHVWPGVHFILRGTDLKFAEVFFDEEFAGYPGANPLDPLDPDGEKGGSFVVHAGLTPGKRTVSVRVARTDIVVSLPTKISVHPSTSYQLESGFGFTNSGLDDSLSYPQIVTNDGRYKDVFGSEQVYAHAMFCVGIVAWTPYDGWSCLGYREDVAIGPDPVAEIIYLAWFRDIARIGRCYGIALRSMEIYYGDLDLSEMYGGAVDPCRDLPEIEGKIKRSVNNAQGSQIALETALQTTTSWLSSLLPGGIERWLDAVTSSIRRGQPLFVGIQCDEGDHGAVAYDYYETDEVAYVYVYDPNREYFCNETLNNVAAHNGLHPPYIKIEKTGLFYWNWYFEFEEDEVWTGNTGLFFVEYETAHGADSLPELSDIWITSSGAAAVRIEDDAGGIVGVEDDGSIVWDGIDGAAPLPNFSGKGALPKAWVLPTSKAYTSVVIGQQDGTYDWAILNGGKSSLHVTSETSVEEKDEIAAEYGDFPYQAKLNFTAGRGKDYTVTLAHKYVQEDPDTFITRSLKYTSHIGAGGTHAVAWNEDYSGLQFTNDATEDCSLAVEFVTNAVNESDWPDGPPTSLLVATREISVGAGEEVDVYVPADRWTELQLLDSIPVWPPLVLCNAPSNASPPDFPLDITATASEDDVVLTVSDHKCFKKKKKTNKKRKNLFRKKTNRPKTMKTKNCPSSTSGALLSISKSGGVGTTHTWVVNAANNLGRSMQVECSFTVAKPGKL